MSGKPRRKDAHLHAACLQDFTRQDGNGGPGGRHVIDNKDMMALQLSGLHERERALHVVVALGTGQTGLRGDVLLNRAKPNVAIYKNQM